MFKFDFRFRRVCHAVLSAVVVVGVMCASLVSKLPGSQVLSAESKNESTRYTVIDGGSSEIGSEESASQSDVSSTAHSQSGSNNDSGSDGDGDSSDDTTGDAGDDDEDSDGVGDGDAHSRQTNVVSARSVGEDTSWSFETRQYGASDVDRRSPFFKALDCADLDAPGDAHRGRDGSSDDEGQSSPDEHPDSTPDAGDGVQTGARSQVTLSDHANEQTEFMWTVGTGTSMDDVGGLDSIKDELTRDVVVPLISGQERAERFGIPLPNVLLHGPPGTGKTHLAKALATRIGLPSTMVTGSDVSSKWINESTDKVKALFEDAEYLATNYGGAVIIIEEIDSVLRERAGDDGHAEDTKVVNEFLSHLQEAMDNILVIGTTNKRDALDSAATRSGRIDKELHIGEPDAKGRRKVLEAQLADRPSALSDADLEAVVEGTDGAVAADIESIVLQAARHAAFQRSGDAITRSDIEHALDESTFDAD